MQLQSQTFRDGDTIPARCALGVPAIAFDAMGVPVPIPAGAQPGPNRSPQLTWTDAPSGTQSFMITCIDRDAPAVLDDVDQSGRTVPYSLPRTEFVHWLLVDIPASISELREGQDADGLTPHGKAPRSLAHGVRGLNDFSVRFRDDPQLEGQYAGYDGPWPPNNDERVHHYIFTVYALDVPTLDLSGAFTLVDARCAMEGHILAESSLHGSYAIYDEAAN
jgi:Raf kinase inhibitor-like YbhB/YbcL family protein